MLPPARGACLEGLLDPGKGSPCQGPVTMRLRGERPRSETRHEEAASTVCWDGGRDRVRRRGPGRGGMAPRPGQDGVGCDGEGPGHDGLGLPGQVMMGWPYPVPPPSTCSPKPPGCLPQPRHPAAAGLTGNLQPASQHLRRSGRRST